MFKTVRQEANEEDLAEIPIYGSRWIQGYIVRRCGIDRYEIEDEPIARFEDVIWFLETHMNPEEE